MGDYAEQLMKAENQKVLIEALLGHLAWVLIGAVFLFMFRAFIDQFVHGIVWKIGRRYNETDIIKLNGDFGRIVRMGLFNMEIYVYILDKNEKVVGGYSYMIPNDKLRDLKIMKPLSNVAIPSALKSIHV